MKREEVVFGSNSSEKPGYTFPGIHVWYLKMGAAANGKMPDHRGNIGEVRRVVIIFRSGGGHPVRVVCIGVKPTLDDIRLRYHAAAPQLNVTNWITGDSH
jgi:hypothetical protein